MRAYRSITTRGVAVTALALIAASADAQMPNSSAAAAGMAGNFTAIARGYEAVAWNPANLAMPGRPMLSFGAVILGGTAGMTPVDVSAWNKWSGKDIDAATRQQWVDQARLAGGQAVNLDGEVTYLGLSVGPFAIQAGTSFYTSMNLSPDAFDAILGGNADANNQPRTLDFTGTRVRGAAISTGAVSFAIPIPINLTNGMLAHEKAAIGVSGKYVLGNGLVIAEDNGSSVSNDVLLRFPVVMSDTGSKGQGGTGTAADISIAWSGGPWRVGLLAENVFNSFKWDTTKLRFRPGTGTFDASGSGTTDFDEQPYSNAPQALRDLVTQQVFKPAIRVGAALNVSSSLTLTADMKSTMGGDEAIILGDRSHVGVGAEWRLLSFLPLRGGVASVNDGWAAGAGVGLRLLGYELGLSTSLRRRGSATASGVMLGLVGIGR